MKKPNLIVIIAVIVLIAAVALLAALMPQSRTLPEDAPAIFPTQTAAPEALPSAVPSAEGIQPSEQPHSDEETPIKAYLVLSVRGMLYEPLPLAGEGAFTITQDENTTNTVHVTPDSVWMEHSTCDNQDCVDQGVVSLDNMSTRVLSNMIICLPNEVVLELYTPETLESTFGVTP